MAVYLPLDLPPADRRWRSYAAYLRSELWAALRAEVLARDGYRCRFCDSDERIEAHHRRYPERWGEETADDLTSVCRDCHEILFWFRRRAIRANGLKARENNA